MGKVKRGLSGMSAKDIKNDWGKRMKPARIKKGNLTSSVKKMFRVM